MKKIITRIGIALLVTTSTGVASSVVAPKTTNAASMVWIAPRHGKKYHFARHCRGLRFAGKHVKHESLRLAKSQGYKLCGIERR